MDNLMFLYAGSILPFIWGVMHLFPTKNVVKGFGEISASNQEYNFNGMDC